MSPPTLSRLIAALLVAAFIVVISASSSGGPFRAKAATLARTGTPTPLVAAAHAEFLGTATFHGQSALDGTVIEALIGDIVCGTATTLGGRYDISVRSGQGSGVDFQPGCAGSGPNTDTVVFRAGELIATERAQFTPHVAQELNLTFGPGPVAPELTDFNETTITWRDNSDNEDGFRLDVTINGQPHSFEVGPNVTSFRLPAELEFRCGDSRIVLTAFNAAGETASTTSIGGITDCFRELPPLGNAGRHGSGVPEAVYVLAAVAIASFAAAAALRTRR